MANLHAALDSTCKSRISTIPHLGGIHSTTFDCNVRNERFTLISFMEIPAILSTLQPFQIYVFNRKNGKETFSNGLQLMEKRFMANLHASLDNTCKSRISTISHIGGSIPQLLILKWEMKYLHWYLLWGFLKYKYIAISNLHFLKKK